MKFEKGKSAEIILVLVGAFIVFYWIWNMKIFLLLALILVAITVCSPSTARHIAMLWMKLGQLLGSVMSKILLTIVYYIFLLPIATLYRLFKKDFLHLHRQNSTYFTPRNHLYTGRDLENLW